MLEVLMLADRVSLKVLNESCALRGAGCLLSSVKLSGCAEGLSE
jgi:hypothetical protein